MKKNQNNKNDKIPTEIDNITKWINYFKMKPIKAIGFILIIIILSLLSINFTKTIERFSNSDEKKNGVQPNELPNITNINNNNIIINNDESKKNDEIKSPSPSKPQNPLSPNTKIPSKPHNQNNATIIEPIENPIIKNLKKFYPQIKGFYIAFQYKFDKSLEQSFKQTYSISINEFYADIENEIELILKNNFPELSIIDKSALPKYFDTIAIENQKEALKNNCVVAVIIIKLNANKIILTLKFVDNSKIETLGIIELPANLKDKIGKIINEAQ